MKLIPSRAATVIAGFICSLCVAAPATADRLPYRLPGAVPGGARSPRIAAGAPFTPLVKKLIHQLEPSNPPTPAELMNADQLLIGVGIPNPVCTTVGADRAPTGTHPAIAPLCWTDAQGINVTSGAQLRQTTAPPLRIAMSSSWDTKILNAWGQVEGREGRWLGITGLYGPQVDLVRIPDWGRNLTIFGEDPFQDGTLSTAEVNGIQGKGLMSQEKHFALYNGQTMDLDSQVQDQAAHELYLQPYEYGTSGSGVLPHAGQASSLMCSYARYELVSAPHVSGSPPSELTPAGGALSCDNQLKNYATRHEWRWPGFFAADYIFAMDSTRQSIVSGNDQEQPTSVWFGPPLVAAVEAHVVPLKAFNTALARILYQEERFHLLGHPNASSNYRSRSNPSESQGKWAIPPAMKAKDGGIVERASEEGAVMLKNSRRELPVTKHDLRQGVLVIGESAEYMPADPGSEAANGYPDRDAISPLEQLKQFAPRRSKITFLPYMPGSSPSASDGFPVPRSALSTNGKKGGKGLKRTAGPGAPRVDRQIDFTKVSGHGQLAFGKTYTWSGFVKVPKADDYTFRFQFSVPSYSIGSGGGVNAGGVVNAPSCSDSGAPTFSLATDSGTGQSMSQESLSSSPSTVGGIPTSPTMSGYTERGLANCDFDAGTLSPGVHQIQISWTSPAKFARDRYHLREPGSRRPSFRFAYSRTAGDRAAAIGAARRASKVIVFADCTCVGEISLSTAPVNALDAGPTQLIKEMAKANHHTAVVANLDVATLMPWLRSVKAVLQTWYPGSEGGTATARLLLGRADPSGHLTSTWPRKSTDTIFGYNETKPLYPGDSTGTHPERLNGNGPFIAWTEGMFVGYRFFDREALKPLFPFGWGLSYTRFRYSHLRVRRAGGGLNVSFNVTNIGKVTGATVPQVYLGPARKVPAGVQQAVRSLAGFDRITLRPHHAVRLTIHLGPGKDVNGNGNRRAFQYWDTTKQKWRTASGRRRVWVGSADAASDLPLTRLAPSPR
ncbi:MAG: glycoside hydrolase family 3 C-terminal domain-containing protein [Solirubrobacteraceae bacterium]